MIKTIYALLDAGILWGLGISLVIHTLRRWNDPNKRVHRISELVMACLFGFMGYYTLIFMDPESSQRAHFIFYSRIFIFYFAFIVFFLGFNILPNVIRLKFNPDFRQGESYQKFLEKLQKVYDTPHHSVKADFLKDFLRKMLHFIQFGMLVFLHEISQRNAAIIATWSYSADEFRNFLLILGSGFFFLMMIIGDLIRMDWWKFLPRWGMWWYSKSLEPRREAWTVNAGVSILLANLLWVHPAIPFQVFICGTFVSTIGDAVASMVGKRFGRHKLTKIGKFPMKSYEGLIGAATVVFIGVISLLRIYPYPGMTWEITFLCGLLATMSFMIIDLYVVKICDNLINGLIPAFLLWIVFLII